MKCHECGQHQADSNTACCACGVSFSAGNNVPNPIVFYEPESAARFNGKAIFGVIAVVCLVGALVLFRSGNTAPAKVAESRSDEPHLRDSHFGRERMSALDDACMQNLMEMGSDELSARASCYDDPKAKEQLKKGYEQDAMMRNAVNTDQISRVELLIASEKTGADETAQPFTLRLRLYDQNGKPASSDGAVKFSFSPEQAVWGGFHSTHIYKNNARIAHIKSDDSYVPFYEFSGYVAKKNELADASEIEITVTFADSLESTARFSIEYIAEESTGE